MMIDTRKISGHIFHFHSSHPNKRAAQKEAQWLRKQGNLVRVFSATPWKEHYLDPSVKYAVYTSRAKGVRR
jgi:hypothetical protein